MKTFTKFLSVVIIIFAGCKLTFGQIDTSAKTMGSLNNDLSINLAGGITFSSGLSSSFTKYFESKGYEVNGAMNSVSLETGVEFKIFENAYLYPKFEVSISRVSIEHGSPFPNSERANSMLSPGVELRYSFLDFGKSSLSVNGGINFNTFNSFSDNFKAEPDGAGFDLSIVLMTQVSNSIIGGAELGYSHRPFKISSFDYSLYETTDEKYNFGGVYLNGIFNFGLLNY